MEASLQLASSRVSPPASSGPVSRQRGWTLAPRRPDSPSRRCQGAFPEASAPRLPGGGGDVGSHVGSWLCTLCPSHLQGGARGWQPMRVTGADTCARLCLPQSHSPRRPASQAILGPSPAPRPQTSTGHRSPSTKAATEGAVGTGWSPRPGPPSWAILPAAPPMTPAPGPELSAC